VFSLFAFLKGLRAPGDWPLTQAQIDYSHGFVKRGLQGAFLSLLHIHRFHPLSAYFFVQLALLLALLIALVRSARVEERFGSVLPVALFATSYAVTFLTHAVGYTDIPLAMVLVVLLLVRDPAGRFGWALLLVPVALLVHESFLLMFLPVLLFSFLTDALLAGHRAQRRRTLVAAVALSVLALGITLAFSIKPNMDQDQIDRFEAEIEQRVDFDVRDDFFNVLSRPLSGSFEEAWDGLTYADWYEKDLATLADLLPPVLLLFYFTRRMLREALPGEDRRGERRLLWGAAILATLAPLGMYLLGVDGGRWNTTAALAGLLVFLVLCRRLPAAPLRVSPAERNLAVMMLAFNMAAGMGLFDQAVVNNFPFLPAAWKQFRPTLPAPPS
jgi:hypothetical protein